MRYLKSFIEISSIKEAIIDSPSKNLSDIFDSSGKVLQEVKSTIQKGIEIIQNQFPNLKILDYFVVGAAVTYQYSETSDIDTTVTLDPSTDAGLMKKVDKWIEVNLDNKFYHKKRPYQFKVSVKTREELDSADSAYDVKTDQWLKKPDYNKSVQMFNTKITDPKSEENKIYTRMEKFVRPSLERLYQSLVNKSDENTIKNNIIFAYAKYGEYSKFDPETKIDKNKEGFIKKFRSSSYEKGIEMNYVSQNWGKGNVIYKMFDEEGYISVFDLLKSIIKDKKFSDPQILRELEERLEKVIKDEIGYKP